MSEKEDVTTLFEKDSGEDDSVKQNEFDEFRVKKDQKYRLCVLYPEHFKAKVFETDISGKFQRLYYKKGTKLENKVEPTDIWFNIVYEYRLDQSGKPSVPVQGEIKFFKFKKDKYIAIRNILESMKEFRGDTDVRVDDFDMSVALRDAEEYQKMDFTQLPTNFLKQMALMEAMKVVKDNGENVDKAKEVLGDLYDKVKKIFSEFQETKKLPANISLTNDELKKISSLYKQVMDRADAIVKHIPKYAKFAKNLSAEEINDMLDPNKKPVGEDQIKSDVTSDDIQNMLS